MAIVCLAIISACATSPTIKKPSIVKTNSASNTEPSRHYDAGAAEYLKCENAERYEYTIVGDGHCVSLIKKCSGAPDTVNWRPGPYVIDSEVAPGTIIATFKNGRYPSKAGYHAAVFIEQSNDGIWVWDQWKGKPVHKRLIKYQNRETSYESNRAQAYRVVYINKEH